MEEPEEFEIDLGESDAEEESEVEESESEEEVDSDSEVEEPEEIEEVEEPEEVIDAPEDNIQIEEEDGGNIADYMTDDTFSNKTKKRLRSIQRYYKTSKEVQARQRMRFQKPSEYLMEQILTSCTTSNNAAHFSKVCQNTNDLYQLCGKLIQKEFAFSALYQEMEKQCTGWESKTYDKQREEERQLIQVMTVKLSVTEGLYQCSRCKSQKTFSRQVQTRSADEGMTSIIQCSECNKVWKEYA